MRPAPTVHGQLHLDSNRVIRQVRAVVRGRRHVVADVHQTQQGVGLLQDVDQLRSEQRGGHLVVVADDDPAATDLTQFRSVLKSHLMAHVLLRVHITHSPLRGHSSQNAPPCNRAFYTEQR